MRTYINMNQVHQGNFMRKVKEYATSGHNLHAQGDEYKGSQLSAAQQRNVNEDFGYDHDQVFTVEDSQSRSSTRQPAMAGASSSQSIHNFQKPVVHSGNDRALRNSPSPGNSYEAVWQQHPGRFANNGHSYASVPYQHISNPTS